MIWQNWDVTGKVESCHWMTTEVALTSKWIARSCKWQPSAQERQEEHRFPKGNALRKKQEFNVSMSWAVATTSNLVINSPYNDLAAFFTALHPLMLLPTATGWLHHCRGLETNPLRHRAGLELATQLCSMPPLVINHPKPEEHNVTTQSSFLFCPENNETKCCTNRVKILLLI